LPSPNQDDGLNQVGSNSERAKMTRLNLVLAAITLMLTTVGCRPQEIPKEYSDFKDSYFSLPLDTEIPVGELFKMKLESSFLWVTKGKGPPIPYINPSINTCRKIPAELTSVHNDSIALIEVSVCNIEGEYFYRVPITS
jgi:hypothetical protein